MYRRVSEHFFHLVFFAEAHVLRGGDVSDLNSRVSFVSCFGYLSLLPTLITPAIYSRLQASISQSFFFFEKGVVELMKALRKSQPYYYYYYSC